MRVGEGERGGMRRQRDITHVFEQSREDESKFKRAEKTRAN
jgi:hypothetical protein